MISVWFQRMADGTGSRSDKRASRAARALLRQAMQAVGWGACRVRTLPSGKPVVDGPDRFISLSHTDGLVACALADVPIGIDVERTNQKRDMLSIARTWMHESERRMLAALPVAHREQQFLRHFTLREAFVKATGVGLGGEPDDLRFDLSTTEGRETAQVHGASDSESWRCEVLEPFPGYVAAIVSSADDTAGFARSSAAAPFLRPMVDKPKWRLH